jgi:GTPase
MDERMLELESLVSSYGGVVIVEHLQKRGIPDYNTYIWSWKLDDIMTEMELQDAHLLILGNILKPHQIYNINQKLKWVGSVAWDRVDLILKIFEKNAKTTESRLQIELAAIKHMWPRIFGMGFELSRQGWGSKLARGKGETNTEIMKRHLAKREMEIKKELEKYKKVRENHRQARKKKWLVTVGIVGYTNAGKSSLLNALTNKWVLAENKLFATLGTSVGKMWIAPKTQEENSYTQGLEILLSDTIGFIRDLPPELVDAFASTLEDSIESDLLFHVVDAGDKKLDEKIQIVDDILSRIGAKQEKVYVFNKIDMLSKKGVSELKKRHKDKKTLFVSTYEKTGFLSIEKYLSKFVATL